MSLLYRMLKDLEQRKTQADAGAGKAVALLGGKLAAGTAGGGGSQRTLLLAAATLLVAGGAVVSGAIKPNEIKAMLGMTAPPVAAPATTLAAPATPLAVPTAPVAPSAPGAAPVAPPAPPATTVAVAAPASPAAGTVAPVAVQTSAAASPVAAPVTPPLAAAPIVEVGYTSPDRSTATAGASGGDSAPVVAAAPVEGDPESRGAGQAVVSPAAARMEVAPTPEELATTRYHSAMEAARDGQVAESIAELRALLKLAPRHEQGRLLLVQQLHAAGSNSEAESLLEAGLQLGITPELAMYRARILAERNELPRAIALLGRVVSGGGQEHLQVEAFLAALHQRQGDHWRAIELYEGLLERQPSQGTWWLGMGISLEQVGEGSEALMAFRRAIDSGQLNLRLRNFVNGRIKALSN